MINWQAYLPHDVAAQLSRWERCCLAAAETAKDAVLHAFLSAHMLPTCHSGP